NYTWNFGDGNVSYEQNPTHKYADDGIYTVTLTVTDNDGATNSTSRDISVYVFVLINKTKSGVENTINASEINTKVTLNTTRPINVTIGNYTHNPIGNISIPTVGFYIDISVEDEDAVKWPINITIYYTSEDLNESGLAEDNLLGIYYWDENKDTWCLYNETGVNTTDVVLEDKQYAGYCWANAYKGQLSPKVIGGDNPPNKPSKPSGPSSGYTGTTYTFSTSTTDPEGDQIKYGWDWNGDGNVDEWTGFNNSGVTVSRSHSWSSAGTYTIKVIAQDSKGKNSSWSDPATITISKKSTGGGGGWTPSPPAENHPPSAPSKPSGPTSGYVNQSYYYSTSSTDPDGDLLRYIFDWGDGTTTEISDLKPSGETVTSSHSWSQPGTYQIKVKAIDIQNAESNWSEPLTVTISSPTAQNLPVAIFSAPDSAVVNQTITLDASQSRDPDGNIANYTWQFGDGSTAYGVIVTHSYSEPGNYTITLTVIDNDGLSNSTSKQIEIQPDSDSDGWSDQEEQTYGTDPYNASSYPQDTDKDRLPDTVDPDDDNDGLIDTLEQEIGSPQDSANEYAEPVIDGKTTYLVDTDNDSIYDIFYDPETSTKTNVEQNEEGKYLIDSDGDGEWDYIYDPVAGSIIPKEEEIPPSYEPSTITLLIVAAILIVAFVGIVFYLKRKS
ncbi:MAG: hypothetical protein DRN18_02660, partial [Thermoplasmata archaeon]